MSEEINQQDLTPKRIAFIIDNKVVDILQTDERLAAIFLSEPEIVNITDIEQQFFPAVDWEYDAVLDKFIQPKPFDSWTFNSEKMHWEAPIPFPQGDPENGIYYVWDEDTISWKLSQPE